MLQDFILILSLLFHFLVPSAFLIRIIGLGGGDVAGVRQRVHIACADANYGRPDEPAQLHHADRALREGGEHPQLHDVLDELLPISIEMAKRNLRGIWNFTNPGVVSHNEILEMYKEYVDPTFTYKNFSLEEQAKVIVAARSNNELDASKLSKEFPEMLPIKESLIKYVFELNKKTSKA